MKTREKHGLAHTPEYAVWEAMVQRTTNPSCRAWKFYGALGVKMCTRWRNSFKSFYEDMGARPEGATLDRIDTYGDYEPDNCRWADWKTQKWNKRPSTLNTSGYTGVDPIGGKWDARIKLDGVKIYLGRFPRLEDALSIRYAAEAQLADLH